MAVGSGLLMISLNLLFRLTVSPFSVAGLGLASTWMLVVSVVAMRIVWNTFRDGNNMFVVNSALGWGAMAFGVSGVGGIGFTLVSALRRHPHAGGLLEGEVHWTDAVLAAAVPVSLWMFVRANTLFARSRQYLAQTVPSPSALAGVDYSLYLRTFGDDDRLASPQSFSPVKRALRGTLITELPEEVHLVDALSTADDPMVAVGRPGEPTPQVGALRMYLPDDWQPPVRELIRGARHVALTLGWGEGTLWELGEAMRLLKPERLILVVAMDRTEYERFRVRSAAVLAAHARAHPRDNGQSWTPPRLPDWGGSGELRSPIQALIHFSLDWVGTFEPVRRYSPVHNSLRIAIMVAAHPAFRRLGYPPRGVFRALPVDTIR
ncbi:hypothetical protein ACQPZF_17690 [Actinosynnema sp. CS-041913]|uniref:hypothetical protein n=1 Tax=Actinosynnema sp. CS-041913 TaxID=3239917 RepID=UPI003D8B2914